MWYKLQNLEKVVKYLWEGLGCEYGSIDIIEVFEGFMDGGSRKFLNLFYLVIEGKLVNCDFVFNM